MWSLWSRALSDRGRKLSEARSHLFAHFWSLLWNSRLRWKASLAVPAGHPELFAPLYLEVVGQLDDGHDVHLIVANVIPGSGGEDVAAAQVFPERSKLWFSLSIIEILQGVASARRSGWSWLSCYLSDSASWSYIRRNCWWWNIPNLS